MFLTGDEGPQVEAHGALQCFIGSAKGVEEEEAGGHGGEQDHNTTEEDDGDVEAGWEDTEQVWEDWERESKEPAGERKHWQSCWATTTFLRIRIRKSLKKHIIVL